MCHIGLRVHEALALLRCCSGHFVPLEQLYIAHHTQLLLLLSLCCMCGSLQGRVFGRVDTLTKVSVPTDNTTGMTSGGRRSSAPPPSMLTLS